MQVYAQGFARGRQTSHDRRAQDDRAQIDHHLQVGLGLIDRHAGGREHLRENGRSLKCDVGAERSRQRRQQEGLRQQHAYQAKPPGADR